MPDVVVQKDSGLRIVWANDAAKKLNPDLLGRTCYEAFLGQKEPCSECNALNAIESGEIQRKTIFHENVAGKGDSYWEKTSVPIMDSEGKCHFVVELTKDISREKEAQEYKYKLASIIESAEDGIIGTDPDGTISSWNKGAEVTFGYTEDEVLGKNIDLISAEGYESELKSIIERVKNGEKTRHYTTKRKRKDGKIIDISLTVSPIFNEYNEITGVSGILRDISDIVEARRKVEESHKWNSIVLRSIGDAIISTDMDCNVTYMNPVAESLTGWTLDEARKNSLSEIFRITNEYTGEVVASPVEKVLREGKVVGLANHTILTARNGDVWPIDDSGAPIMDANGEITGAVIVFREISARKKAEKRLRDSESKYRAVFNSTGAATVIIDKEGTILLSNAGYEKLSGYSSAEIDGRMKWTDFVDEESLAFMSERSDKRDGLSSLYHDSYEFTFVDRFGKSHGILLILESIEGSEDVVCNLIDISDQKKIQNDLLVSENKVTTILNSMPDVVMQKDRDMRILWANDAAKKLSPALIDRTCYEAFLGNKEPCNGCNSLCALKSGEIQKKTMFHKNVAGKADRYWENTSIPIMDSNGKCTFVVELAKDVTPAVHSKGRFTFQHNLAGKLSATSSLSDAVRVLFESLLEIPGIDSGMLYLADEVKGGLSRVLSKGITEEYRKSVSYLEPESGCVKRLADNRPIYGRIDDISPHLVEISTFEGLRSFAYIPIVANEEILGACFLISHTHGDVPEFSRQILESTNDLVGNSFSRVITEEKLRKSGERLDIAIKSAEFFVWEYSVEDQKIRWNNNLLNKLGYLCDDVVDSEWWSSLVYPGDCDERIKSLNASISGNEEFYSSEYRVKAFSGEWRWLNVLGKATNRNSDGKATHLVGVIQDITKIKENESALKVANKKLNLLSCITRHDIVNQVTPALMYIEMIRDFYQADSSLMDNLDIIENCIDEISNQIEFTKDYQDLGLKMPLWQDIISAAEKAKNDTALSSIELNISCTCKDIEIFADPMFERIFFNLFDNSVRHGEGVSEISIYCREDEGNVKIIYRDNGAGVPIDMKKKIFSKGIGRNTGLGLFLIKEILDITGMKIEENGIPGEYGQFEISVPNGKWRFVGE